ncbi:restriction endonuclease subunit S [Propionivibrio sp.]|uniref:restriction endonuclease subunit S n=1 Tax=Propionivibrio sp. TaxID=2212460 RepID=UPI00262F4FAE|nr:restriction endonuclease subunit S [Propionivibrio sp.]
MTELGQVASIRMGYPFRSRLEHDAAGAIAVVQMKDIDDASLLHLEDAVRVNMPDFNEHHLIRQGDLVFRSRGRTNSVALISEDMGPAVLAAPMLLIRPVDVLPAYLLWYINLPAIQAALAAQAEGTAVRMISKAALEQLEIVIPPLATQRRIVEIGQLASLEARIASELIDRRKALVDGILMRKAQDAAARTGKPSAPHRHQRNFG